MTRHLVFLALIALPTHLAAQETRTEGDSTVKAAIDAQAQMVYDSAKGWNWAFTRANLLSVRGAHGTEMQAAHWNGEPVRLIAGGWDAEGKFGAEYYRVDGKLVFVYQSGERFQETARPGWRNFKGLSGWERRVYLVNGTIAYVETTGSGAPPVTADLLHDNVAKLLAVLKR